MALSEQTLDDKIEVVSQFKMIQVRTARVIYDDGVEISRSFSRRVISPNDDVSNETSEIQAIASAVHTDEVKAAYAAHLASQSEGMA